MNKKKINYKQLFEYILNSNDELAFNSIPEYPAVLSHYLFDYSRDPVFGGNTFKVACEKSIYGFSESMGKKPISDITQLQLNFDDIPYPPPQNAKFTFIDLFAGIGGIRIAFQKAYGKCVFSSEWDSHAQKTYYANFGEIPFGDIKQFTDSETVSDSRLYKLIPDHDVLCAGFPCQPFSLAGVSKKNSLGRAHGFKDPTQGTLFFDIKRILKIKRPKAFFLENVKNLISHDNGRTFQVISDSLNELGYIWTYKVVDASKWVPQNRKRIFIVGFNPDLINITSEKIVIPDAPDSKYNYPELSTIISNNVDKKYTLGPGTWSTLERHKEHHAQAGNGFGYGLIPFPVPNKLITRTISARYHKDGAEILIEQKGLRPRRLTVEEAMQLQGFEKNKFVFPVSDTQAYRQIGNSVAVPVVAATALEICKVIQK